MSGYRTRLKARAEKNAAKFNEIFVAVVHKASSSTSSETESSLSYDSETSSSTSSCLSAKEKAPLFVCSTCFAPYAKHVQLHAHIALEHGKTLISCSHCNATSYSLWKTNVCKICKSFTVKLDEHEASHYQDKIGKGAIFECSRCYRSFNEYASLKKHIIGVHEGRIVIKEYRCQVCKCTFESRHQRDQHLVSHFESYLNSIYDTTAHLENVQSNQCPLCFLTLSSLRTFRLHVIYRHLLHGLTECGQLRSNEEIIFYQKMGTEVKVEAQNVSLFNNESTNATIKVERDSIDTKPI